MKNNYLFDKKRGKLFFTGFFSSAKNSRFITRARSFFIGHEVLFYETTFSASGLEH
jgi:hypothetical protein